MAWPWPRSSLWLFCMRVCERESARARERESACSVCIRPARAHAHTRVYFVHLYLSVTDFNLELPVYCIREKTKHPQPASHTHIQPNTTHTTQYNSTQPTQLSKRLPFALFALLTLRLKSWVRLHSREICTYHATVCVCVCV